MGNFACLSLFEKSEPQLGVNYPVDNQNMVRPKSILSTNVTCNTALQNSTIGSNPPVTLGLSFMRSVYLAYRFPTVDCPKAFYGFAYPKGANRTEAEIRQQPRTTPTLASQCLNLKSPSTTPTPTTEIHIPERTLDNNVRSPLPGERTWKVYGRPEDEPEVLLRDVDGVPFIQLRGAGDDNGLGGFFS